MRNPNQPMSAPAGFNQTGQAPTSSPYADAAKAAISSNDTQSARGAGSDIIFWDAKAPMTQGSRNEVTIRILPPWDASKPFWQRTELHFARYQDENGDWKHKAWDCASVFGHECPGNSVKIRLFQQSNQANEPKYGGNSPIRDLARELQTKTRVYFNALIMSDPNIHSVDGVLKPVVLRVGKQIADQIMSLEQYSGPISDWQWGYDLKLVSSKTGPQRFNVEHKIHIGGQRSAIPQEWWPALENLNDLSELVRPITVEEEAELMAEYFPSSYGANVMTTSRRQDAPVVQAAQSHPVVTMPTSPVPGTAPQQGVVAAPPGFATTSPPGFAATPGPGGGGMKSWGVNDLNDDDVPF